MERIILETRALCKNFRNQKAVNQVSLQVPENHVYGLLGPNGAGKSTLLKMATGMLRPDSGEILFEGEPWTRKALGKIGALIEVPAIYDNLTARENLQVRTTLLGLPERRIDEALEKAGITGTGQRPGPLWDTGASGNDPKASGGRGYRNPVQPYSGGGRADRRSYRNHGERPSGLSGRPAGKGASGEEVSTGGRKMQGGGRL